VYPVGLDDNMGGSSRPYGDEMAQQMWDDDLPKQDPITNAAGEVAMKYYQEMQILVPCGRDDGTKGQYVFVVRNHVALSWVDPRDIPCLRAIRGGCCGNRRPGVILYANARDVELWMGQKPGED